LTPAGEHIVELARVQIEGADRIRRLATAARSPTLKETVTVSAAEFVVSERLAPALGRLYDRAPNIRIELHSQAHIVSLAARDADLAVRMSRPMGNSLLIRKLGRIDLGLFASATYLAGRSPDTIDLSGERILTYDDSYGPTPEAAWTAENGLTEAVILRTGSVRALLNAAIAGLGIGLLPAHAARSAGLMEIPTADPFAPRIPWLVVHRDLRRVPAIATVHDWIVDVFAPDRRSNA
jgi:DNA-binding transcriptional LysR family regulator